MLEKQVDGLVYMGDRIGEEHIQEFKTSPVPIVLAATVEPSNCIPSVNIDYEQSAYEATKLLINNGHEHPALAMGINQTAANELKYNGFIQALKETGQTVNEDYIYRGDLSYNSGIKAIEQFEALEQKPTAIRSEEHTSELQSRGHL